MFTEHQHFIAVDWGTSHLRAYLCFAEASKPLKVLEQVNNVGVKKVLTDFQTTLMDSIAPWAKRFGHLPILMIGQIGSSIGWKETQYLHCPISPTEVISAGTRFNCQGHQVTIIITYMTQCAAKNFICSDGLPWHRNTLQENT
uniref:2-dehydro-3-deoxygalactonokinase n=1 Tax=Shewanella sp. TaxID=50422 RepID=UPI004048D30A